MNISASTSKGAFIVVYSGGVRGHFASQMSINFFRIEYVVLVRSQ